MENKYVLYSVCIALPTVNYWDASAAQQFHYSVAE